MVKQPTQLGISRVLKKAGFERSVSSPSRIRGWREWTEGYKVTKFSDTKVEIEYLPSSFRVRNTSDEQIRQMLDRYRAVVVAAGYAVTNRAAAMGDRLVVSAPDEKTEE